MSAFLNVKHREWAYGQYENIDKCVSSIIWTRSRQLMAFILKGHVRWLWPTWLMKTFKIKIANLNFDTLFPDNSKSELEIALPLIFRLDLHYCLASIEIQKYVYCNFSLLYGTQTFFTPPQKNPIFGQPNKISLNHIPWGELAHHSSKYLGGWNLMNSD